MIKIRFVEILKGGEVIYQAQRKRWYGWRLIRYVDEFDPNGLSFYKTFRSHDKETLRQKLAEALNWSGKDICEYPEIKIHRS